MDDDREAFRRQRRAPKGRQRLGDLQDAEGIVARLQERGLIGGVLRELRSGKEATAYVVQAPQGPALLKVYRSPEVRSFSQDARYREGAHRDARAARAVRSRSRYGLSRLENEWVLAEYRQLWRLQQAGLPAPRPLVGPGVREMLGTAPAVLMTLIGDGEEPAPRLSDLNPDDETRALWVEQSFDIAAALLRLGTVHGDLSAYNLLWSGERVHVIDFPQAVGRTNPHFDALLRRDLENLLGSLRVPAGERDVDAALRTVRARAAASP